MKQIKCSIIDDPGEDWGFFRTVIDRDKYLSFDKESFPDNIFFCNDVLSKDFSIENNDISIIQIIGRIGSDSADAQIYHIRFNDIDFAMKLIPRIDKDSESKSKKEIETATLASQYPNYFPITFAKGFCLDSKYFNCNKNIYNLSQSDKSIFSLENICPSLITKAIKYNKYSKILSLLPNLSQNDKSIKLGNKRDRKIFESLYSNGTDLEELCNRFKVEYPKEETIQIDYFISELANCDLGFFMSQNHSQNNFWSKILTDVATGTYYLTVMLNKVHTDLHPGNILINFNNSSQRDESISFQRDINNSPQRDESISFQRDINNSSQKNQDNQDIIALIHDFGRCYDIPLDENGETIDHEMNKASLLSFCQEFISCSTRTDLCVPREILAVVQNLKSFLDKTEITRNNIKEMYEMVIFPIITGSL